MNDAPTSPRTSGEIVYCLDAIEKGGDSFTHIFSTPEKRAAWWERQDQDDYMGFVSYDYEIDNPERMLERQPPLS